MTTCPECGEPLQPLDVTCSACGAPRPEEQAATRPATTDSASSGPSAIAPSSQLQNDVRLAVLVFLFAVINLLAFPIMNRAAEKTWISLPWLGAIITQFALISVWWVFAPVSALRRTVWGVIAGCLWLALAILGHSFSVTGNTRNYGWTSVRGPWQLDDLYYTLYKSKEFALSIPLLVLLIQLPLWILRIWFRWRIVDRTRVTTVPQPRKLRIRDLMVITGVVAAVLAMARLGNIGNSQSDAEFLGLVFIYGAVVLGAAAITIPPTLSAGMERPRNPKKIWQALIAQAVMLGGAGVGLSFIQKDFPPAEVWGYYCVIVATYFVTMMIIFQDFASRGYRLLTKRDDPPAQPAGRRD